MLNNKLDFKKNKYLQGMALSLFFWIILHMTFVGIFSDDGWFLAMISSADSLRSLLVERYNTWTSRLLTEAVCFILVESPFWIWTILDILVCLLLYHSLTVLLVNNSESQSNIHVAVLMMCYPFMHMASAGWISTTLNYLWPFCFAMYALTGGIRRIRGEKLPIYKYVIYVFCLIFAVNCELPAAFVLLVFLGCLVYRIFVYGLQDNIEKSDSKKSLIQVNSIKLSAIVYELSAIIISIAGIIFAFTCPGNAVRNEIEIRWMPEFPNLNIFEKFRLCAVFVYEHFVAIPDVLFFLFAIMLAFIGVKKSHKMWMNIVAILPVLIDVVYTAVYFFNDFVVGHKRSYDFSFPAIYMTDAKTTFIQMSELAGLIVFIVATIVTIMINFTDVKSKFIAIWALGSGFAVRMSLMLSATMFISWHRTLIYFYFAMICAIVIMYKMLLNPINVNQSGSANQSKNKLKNENQSADMNESNNRENAAKIRLLLVRAIIVCGIVVNIILTVGHQIRVR